MANLLDLMRPEDKKKALERYRRRMQKDENRDNQVSSEIFIISEFGYFYGWQAIEAIRNNQITLEEVNTLLEGARKVWYSRLVETAKTQQVATASSLAKNPNKVFKQGLRPFIEKL